MNTLATTARPSDVALRTIEAQQAADEVVRKLCAGEIGSEALAVELARSYGLPLQALARALTRAVQRGGGA